ncbi:transglycosylase domain-containing protein [Marinactinospora rubrisoli]|uniref:Transglycosylase domain-containing protein n=1 Tax=Marinactinospora rubrisoli TaxID=2715399 RepID=A0ABW2KF40_9ACTN
MDSKQPDPKDSAGDGTGDHPSGPEDAGNDVTPAGDDGPAAATSRADEPGSGTDAEKPPAEDASGSSADSAAADSPTGGTDDVREAGAADEAEFNWFSASSDSPAAGSDDSTTTPSSDEESTAPEGAGGSAAPSGAAGESGASTDSDSTDADSATEDASPYLAASAFEDSGSFFRDKVARSLAEQYGLDLQPDGTIRATDDHAASGDAAEAAPASGPDDAEEAVAAADAGATPPGPAADGAAESAAEPVAPHGAEEGPVNEDRAADEDSAAPQAADDPVHEPEPAGDQAGGTAGVAAGWDPEGTAEFTPVFEDDDDHHAEPPAAEARPDAPETVPGASGTPASAGSGGAGWDPEGTAEFTPVFDDDDDEAEAVSGASTAEGPDSRAADQADDARAAEAPGSAASGAGGAVPGWDPEGTAEFTPVFDDDDDDAADASAASGGVGPAAPASGDGTPHSGRPAFEPAPDPPSPADTDSATAAQDAAAAALGATGVAAGAGFAAGAAAAAASGGAADGPPADSTTAAGAGAVPPKPAKRGKPGKPGKPGKGKAAAAGSGPKNGKPKKKKPLWWRLTRGGLIAVGVCLVLGLAGFGVAYAMIPVPEDAQEQATDEGSTFYYADGETVFAERGVNRDPVSLDEIPKDVQNAILSAEDRGFWTEPGVSIRGTIRAGWSTLTGQQLQGGSTITQQMVRNYYEGLSQEQTISRKLKEIIISIKVDQLQSKDWILEQYLNTIYFGRNAYGIQAAAQAYYHKDVADLTPAEAAFLAAAIQQPTKFGLADSETTPEMEQRWQYVVNGLVTMESITPDQAAEYEFPRPEHEVPQEGIDLSGYNGYMLQQAMAELESLGYTEDNINRGGYQITTTFDQDLMEAAREAVESNVPVDDLPEGVQAGLTAIDPATGEVVAFYGGSDYNENQYDSAFRGAAQAGSAFKPYVLAAALENGFNLNTVVDGSSPQFFNGSEVRNAGGEPGGAMNLIEATRRSNNTGYINLALQVGLENVVDIAHAAGIPDNRITEDQAAAPTLALGVSDVSPVDQASGYSTFANGGQHVDAHVVRSIVNRDGEDEREPVETNRVISEGAAADVTHALRQVVTSGTGTGANLPDGRPVAGKTGTTDSSVAAWFVGYTPQLSTAVGIYNGNNQPFVVPGYGQLSGGSLPTTVWRSFMAAAMEGEEVESFPEPTFGGTTENFAPDVPAPGASNEQEAPPAEPDPPVESTPQEPPPVEPPPVEPPPGGEPEQPDPGFPPPDGGSGGEEPPPEEGTGGPAWPG